MGGKRRAQPSGNTQDKTAANGGAAVVEGAQRKRQTRGMIVDGGAGSEEAGACGQEDSSSIFAPVTMCFAMRCEPSALGGRKAALEAAVEAALRDVVLEFGGRGFRVEWTRVGPSEDTLQRVLPLVLERVMPEWGVLPGVQTSHPHQIVRFVPSGSIPPPLQGMRSAGALEGAISAVLRISFWVAGHLSASGGPCGGPYPLTLHRKQVCKSWRRDMEARGFCRKTVQLCSELAEGGNTERLGQNALRRLNASTGDAERVVCNDANALLQRSKGWEGTLPEWLQAASQEPDASFLSRGAASTARVLGLPLVRCVGTPQGWDPGLSTLAGHSGRVHSVALSADGKWAVSGAGDGRVKIWSVATGAEVSVFECGEMVEVLLQDFISDNVLIKWVLSGFDDHENDVRDHEYE